MQPFVAPLQAAVEHLQMATGHVMEAAMSNYDEIGAASVEYLRLFGLVALGFMWVRMAVIAAEKVQLGAVDAPFYQAKLATARFYVERVLPQAGGLLFAIKAGKAPLMEMPEAAF